MSIIVGVEVCIGLHLPQFPTLGLHQIGDVPNTYITEQFSLALPPPLPIGTHPSPSGTHVAQHICPSPPLQVHITAFTNAGGIVLESAWQVVIGR